MSGQMKYFIWHDLLNLLCFEFSLLIFAVVGIHLLYII